MLRRHPLISHDQHPFGLLSVCSVWFQKRTKICGLVWSSLNWFDFELLCYYFCLVSLWLERDVNRNRWQSDNTQVTWRHPHFSTVCLTAVENCLILFVCIYLWVTFLIFNCWRLWSEILHFCWNTLFFPFLYDKYRSFIMTLSECLKNNAGKWDENTTIHPLIKVCNGCR